MFLTHLKDFVESFFWSVISPNYGEIAFSDHVIEQEVDEEYDDVWEMVFDTELACFIPEESYEEAKMILNNQRAYFNEHFSLSDQDELVLATLCCGILSKLIVWDVCNVQTLERPIDQVMIKTPFSGWIENPVVEALPVKLHRIFDDISSSVDDPLLDYLSTEIAAEINDKVIDVMFSKMGRPKSVKPEMLDIIDAFEPFNEHLGKNPNWMICSMDVASKMGVVGLDAYDRGNITVYHGTLFDNPIKMLVFKNIQRTSELYMGYTVGECNCVAPLYFCPYLILQLSGPMVCPDGSPDRYLTNSVFCCIESQARKKMLRKLKIKQ